MKRERKLSLYPLKFPEVIADVLKVKPDPKAVKKKEVSKRSKTRK